MGVAERSNTAVVQLQNPPDLLMWVGSVYYPSISAFVAEAEQLGVSKRVPFLPPEFKLGESLLFLAHDEGRRIECESCRGLGVVGLVTVRLMTLKKKVWTPAVKVGRVQSITRVVRTAKELERLVANTTRASRGKNRWELVPEQTSCSACDGHGSRPEGSIFGFCVPVRIELVFDCQPAVDEYAVRCRRASLVTPVVGGFDHENERGCGYRQVGASYLVTGAGPSEYAADQTTALHRYIDLHGPIIAFKHPLPYDGHRFRGVKVVQRKDILSRLKKRTIGERTTTRSGSAKRARRTK